MGLALLTAGPSLVVVWMLSVKLELARRDNTVSRLKLLQLQAKLYRARHGHYPSTEEGLKELARSEEFFAGASDSWGHPIQYRLRDDNQPVFWSLGTDGKPGGRFWDADLINDQPPD